MDAQALVQEVEKLKTLEGPLKEGVQKLQTESDKISGLADKLLALYADTATHVTEAVHDAHQAVTHLEETHTQTEQELQTSQTAVDGSVDALKAASTEHKDAIATASGEVTKAKQSYTATLQSGATEHKAVGDTVNQGVTSAHTALQTGQQQLSAANKTVVAHAQEYKTSVETASKETQTKVKALTQHMSDKRKETDQQVQAHRTSLADTQQAITKHLQETLAETQNKARLLAEEIKRKQAEHKQLLADAQEQAHAAAGQLTEHANTAKTAASAAGAKIAPVIAEHSTQHEKLQKGSQEAQKARGTLGI
jgi:hypothetical protein